MVGEPQGSPRTHPRGRGLLRTVKSRGATAQRRARNRVRTLNERDLAWAAKLAMGSREPTRLPVAIDVSAYLEIPSSWSRAKRDAALAGTLLPTGKPDAHNLLKIAADSLRGIVLGDDAAVVDATVRKRYCDDPRLRIKVREFALAPTADR